MNLTQVVDGLAKGKKYKRPLDDSEGWEYLRPIYPLEWEMFTHTVAGNNALGGFGGQADLHMSVLDNKHWAEFGWMEDED